MRQVYRGYVLETRINPSGNAVDVSTFSGEYLDTVLTFESGRALIDHWIEGSVR